jgi:hypothetical protein
MHLINLAKPKERKTTIKEVVEDALACIFMCVLIVVFPVTIQLLTEVAK